MTPARGKKAQPDVIHLERHGDVLIVSPTDQVESMQWEMAESAADLIMAPLRAEPASGVIIDLSHVSYFGSVFLAMLLRCHKYLKTQGAEMVICGASERARELLKLTALDTIWAMYDTRAEALQALA